MPPARLLLVCTAILMLSDACSTTPSTPDATTDRSALADQSPIADPGRGREGRAADGRLWLDVFKPPDGASRVCSPTDLDGDADHDGIPNGVEACLNPNADPDHDGTPSYLDWDSDGDGIADAIEKGERDAQGNCASTAAPKNSWPCDTDGDQVPDFFDLDSDNDKVLDGDEDKNGDGLLGCCVVACSKPGPKQLACPLTADGCGTGQTCQAGVCSPAQSLACANGETDPRKKDN